MYDSQRGDEKRESGPLRRTSPLVKSMFCLLHCWSEHPVAIPHEILGRSDATRRFIEELQTGDIEKARAVYDA